VIAAGSYCRTLPKPRVRGRSADDSGSKKKTKLSEKKKSLVGIHNRSLNLGFLCSRARLHANFGSLFFGHLFDLRLKIYQLCRIVFPSIRTSY